MEVKLDSQFFNKFYNKIDLGPRTDTADDEESLAIAIPKLWSLQLETEFEADLWLTALTGTKPKSCIIRKEDLTKSPGDQLYITKAAGLTAEGDLGTTQTLKDNEENLSLSRVTLFPKRKGNAVAWRHKAGTKVCFDIKVEAKSLLATWSAEKVEKMFLASLEGISESQTLYGGVATSKFDMQQTDTMQGSDLLRMYIMLRDAGARGIGELGGYYALILNPLQFGDLMQDPVFVSAIAASSVAKTFDIEGFVGSYSRFRVFVPQGDLMHTQDSGASPGVTVYSAYALAARSLAAGWSQKLTWLDRGSCEYGEIEGVGCEFELDTQILNENYCIKFLSGATLIR
ncbi:hypothetical protein ES702_05269 [subsurface metagenome]